MPELIDADDFEAESAPLIDNLSSALSGPTVAAWFPKLGPLPTRPNELAAWSRRAYTYHALFDVISLVVSCLVLSKDGAAGSELDGRFIRLGHYYYMSWPLVILFILTCVGLAIVAVLRLSCDGVVWWDLFIIVYNIAVPLLTLPLYGPALYSGDQWQNDWPTTRNLTEQQWQQNLRYVFIHYNSVGHPTNHPHLVWIVLIIVSLVLSVVYCLVYDLAVHSQPLSKRNVKGKDFYLTSYSSWATSCTFLRLSIPLLWTVIAIGLIILSYQYINTAQPIDQLKSWVGGGFVLIAVFFRTCSLHAALFGRWQIRSKPNPAPATPPHINFVMSVS